MNVTVRKEVVRCKKCGNKVVFLYISDFSYGERLALYNNGKKYAYISLLKDKTYNQFVRQIETILQKYKKNILKDRKQDIVDKTFNIACDDIEESNVEFKGKRKCENCGSEEFEDLLVEPEQIVNVDIPQITHKNWDLLSEDEREHTLIKMLENYWR
mgnify:CR=1 FL=1